MSHLKDRSQIHARSLRPRLAGALAGLGLIAAVTAPSAFAQDTAPQTPPPTTSQTTQPAGRITAPTVTVTAQKEPADPQALPVSITVVTKAAINDAAIDVVSDAAKYAPNTFFSEFTARKLSNARFRGIGSSPANPGITTYIDGVPQLNTNSSSIDFMDVQQVEFVRGPQSALFGRNTLGGLVNVESARPSLTRWAGGMMLPFGNRKAWDLRGNVSGPLAKTVGVSLAMGYGERDGFTQNDVTTHTLDTRSATSAKGQFLWTPTAAWVARLIVTSERARDGDYGLNDLAALRANPFHVSRDFEGHTDRNVLATTILTRHEGPKLVFSTITGVVRWKTIDSTDLDYTPLSLITRNNTERDTQFTQEVRFSSAAGAPVKFSNAASLKWQAGAFFFNQNYDQNAVNSFSPFVLSPLVAFPVSLTSPLAALDDHGLGLYGQATMTFNDRLDITAGARVDHENKKANLQTLFAPAIFPATTVTGDKGFSDVSPQIAVAYRVQPGRTVFASVGRGFKAGGFNPASPAGSEGYSEERTWNVEGGVKTSLADGKAIANASVFYINWDALQLNVPTPGAPGQFYIANVGGARSQGFEVEVTGRPRADVELFGSLGYTHARFAGGSVSGGVNVADKTLPNTPDYTASLGVQISRAIGHVTVYGRGEEVIYGTMQYDDANTRAQGGYGVADFRVGARHDHVFVEAWVKNAFDARYIPIAFAYPGLAPSGFIGEMGKPRTFGLQLGVTF
jgi:iron complex outermembrane receptor protein